MSEIYVDNGVDDLIKMKVVSHRKTVDQMIFVIDWYEISIDRKCHRRFSHQRQWSIFPFSVQH